MTITIDIHNWKHKPSNEVVVFVLDKIKEQIDGKVVPNKLSGDYYNENGIEYSVKVKG